MCFFWREMGGYWSENNDVSVGVSVSVSVCVFVCAAMPAVLDKGRPSARMKNGNTDTVLQ